MKIIYYIWYLVLFDPVTRVIEGNKHEILLLETIFKNYDKRSRPVLDYNTSLNITFSVLFLQLLQVDEKHQTITTKIIRSAEWIDYSLKWNPKNYGNISFISVPRGETWLPNIQLFTSASYDTVNGGEVLTVVENDGTVADHVAMVVKSTCQIDVTWFPFDEQICILRFGSWFLTTKYMSLNLITGPEDASEFVENGEWSLIAMEGEKNHIPHECVPDEEYNIITYTLIIKRRSLYYLFHLIIPCCLIGFLAILGFTLPPESDEKLSLGVTVLFSLILFLNMLSQSMPANADAVPLLGTYFNCVMFMIALSVVSTIVINYNLRSINRKEIHGFAKKFFLRSLPLILCMRSFSRTVDPKKRLPKKKVRDIVPMEASLESATQELVEQQWKFVAAVVDRLCLIISLIFTIISVIVFLINAF